MLQCSPGAVISTALLTLQGFTALPECPNLQWTFICLKCESKSQVLIHNWLTGLS